MNAYGGRLVYFTTRIVKRAARDIFLYLVCVAWGIAFIFPFFWTIMSSLKTPPEIYTFPPVWLPAALQWGNYATVFGMVPIIRWLVNSLYVTMLVLLGSILSSSLVAYGFARFQFRGRDLIFLITLGTMMLPAQVTLIPQFLLFHKLHWTNSYRPLWIPAWFGGGAFNIFLIRQFIRSLPIDLDEAALIDGASYLRIFRSVIVPLSKPVLATAAVIVFIGSWNDFINPLIYLDERMKFTIALGLDELTEAMGVSGGGAGQPTFHLLMAACVIAIIPTMMIFFSAQRYFVRGIVMSGIKG